MPLLIAPMEKELVVENVTGDDKVRKHLESLGIVRETSITLLSQEKTGVIVRIKDSRIALGYDIARNIFVDIR